MFNLSVPACTPDPSPHHYQTTRRMVAGPGRGAEGSVVAGAEGSVGMQEEEALVAPSAVNIVVAAVMLAAASIPQQLTGGSRPLRAEGGCQNGCQAAWNCISTAAGH